MCTFTWVLSNALQYGSNLQGHLGESWPNEQKLPIHALTYMFIYKQFGKLAFHFFVTHYDRPCTLNSLTWRLFLWPNSLNSGYCWSKTLPKAQRTRGYSSAFQSNKILHKSWLNSKIQNLSWTSAFRPNFTFKILTKHPLHQTSAAKYWPNFSFKSSLELQLQTLGQTLCSKSEQNLALWPNLSSQICNKLPTRSSSSTSAKVATSKSFELVSSHARVTSIKFTKQQWVSQSVSYWQG